MLYCLDSNEHQERHGLTSDNAAPCETLDSMTYTGSADTAFNTSLLTETWDNMKRQHAVALQ
jgi:hypothetical protein